MEEKTQDISAAQHEETTVPIAEQKAPAQGTAPTIQELQLVTLKKQLFWSRLGTCATLAVLALVGFFVIAVLPSLTTTLRSLNQVLSQLAAVDWNTLSTSLQSNLDTLRKTLDGIDLEALAKAITDLQAVLAPLARLMGG